MNQQPFHPPAREPKLPYIPAAIATVGGILVFVAIFLPLVSVSAEGMTDSLKLSDHFFAGGARLWAAIVFAGALLGILLPWSYIFMAKATPEKRAQRLKSAGLGPVVGVAVAGVAFVLFLLYIFVIEHETEDGTNISYPDIKEQAAQWGLDSSWGMGLYLSILGFILVLVGLVLFVLWYQKVKNDLFLPYMNNGKQNQNIQGQYPHTEQQNLGQPGQQNMQHPHQGQQPGQHSFGQQPGQGQPGPGQQN